MARRKFTPRQVIDALRGTQGLPALAAERLGCSVSTLYNYAERYPAVRRALRHQKEKRIDLVEAKLWAAIHEGNISATIFYLKTQGKSRGYIERQEVTGADGDPLTLAITERIVDAADPA